MGVVIRRLPGGSYSIGESWKISIKNSVKEKGENVFIAREESFEWEFINLKRSHGLVNCDDPFSPPLA